MDNNEGNHELEPVCTPNGSPEGTPREDCSFIDCNGSPKDATKQKWKISDIWRQRCSNKILIPFCISLSLILNVAFSITIIALVTKISEQPHVSPVPCNRWCPDDSILTKGKCYFFSKEEYDWHSGQEFCSKRNASLARIEKEEEEFVKNNMSNKPFWIGLHLNQSSWKWTDGENAKMEISGNGGDCAYLQRWKLGPQGFEKVEASSARCSTEHQVICKSEEPQNQN